MHKFNILFDVQVMIAVERNVDVAGCTYVIRLIGWLYV